MFGRKLPVLKLGRPPTHTLIEQCPARTWIDECRPETLQLGNGSADEIYSLLVLLGEGLLVHVFPDNADAKTLEPTRLCVARITVRRQTSHTEGREFVLRVVTRDHVENARRILHRTTDRADAGVNTLLDHAVSAHELLRRCNTDTVVRVGRTPDGRARLLSDGTGDEVCAHCRTGPRTRAARTALRIVGVAERTAKSTTRNGRGELAEIRLANNDHPGLTEPAHKRRIVWRPIVSVEGIGAGCRPHVDGVILVLDRHNDAV